MKRIIISIIFISSFLFGNKIEFNETKYIDALSMNIVKRGSIKVSKNNLIVNYGKSDSVLIFSSSNITIIKGNDKKVLEYADNLELSIYHSLIMAVYKDDMKKLEDNFSIKVTDKVTLLPNDYIANIIEKIEYKKNNGKLKYLRIHFLNNDRIEIVQTN